MSHLFLLQTILSPGSMPCLSTIPALSSNVYLLTAMLSILSSLKGVVFSSIWKMTPDSSIKSMSKGIYVSCIQKP